MSVNKKTIGVDTKVLLSTLWIFVLFNIIFRDIHEFAKAEAIQEILTGTINGTKITGPLLLMGAFLVEVPIVMVLLSRILKDKINRWANIIAGALTLVVVVTGALRDADDVFFAAVESAALLVIVWHAWKWPKRKA